MEEFGEIAEANHSAAEQRVTQEEVDKARERRLKGEEMFANGWRFAAGYRIPKQGRRKGWMTFKKEGAGGHIQVHPVIGSRICELEVEAQWRTENEDNSR